MFKKKFQTQIGVVAVIAALSCPANAWAMAKRPPVEVKNLPEEIAIAAEIPAVTLSELIQEALKNNPELRAFEERWKAAKARVWREISWDDTMIGADFEGIPRGRSDADRAGNIEWMISQKIPFPGKRFLKGRVAAKEAKMAEQDRHAKEREIISEVKKAYSEYFYRDHEILVHGGARQLLDHLARSAEAQYASRQIPYQEVLKVQTELAEMTNELAKHESRRQVALARLHFLIGRDRRFPLRIVTALREDSLSLDRNQLMELALENRPEFKAMKYGVEAAGADVKGAWLDLLPDGQVRLEARQFPGEGKIREYDQFFGFEVPLLSLLDRAGQIKEKRAEKRAAEGAFENMKNMVLFEVEEALAEFESADRTARMYQTQVVPQAEVLARSAVSDFEAGRGNFSNALEAHKALLEFRHHAIEAQAEREQNFAELERVVGVELTPSWQGQ